MSAIKVLVGDLVALAKEGAFDVIVHGCNCQGTMGAGIARAIRAAFPAAYAADLATVKGDRSKLGTCSAAVCGDVTVVNAYTQFDFRGAGVKADYDAIRRCLAWVAATYPDKRIGLPKIGAGLAGGDWGVIEKIVAETLAGVDATVVVLP